MIKGLAKNLNKLATIYQLILLAFLGGSIATLSKIALVGVPSMTFVFLRLLIVTIVLAIMGNLTKLNITREKVKLFLGVSTFWWITMLVFPFGLLRTTAITSQFLLVSTPILTALISTFFLRKGLNRAQWLGIVIAAIGVSYIIFNGKVPDFSDKYLIGNLIILFSQVTFASYAAFSQSKKYESISPFEMIFIAAAIGTIMALPLAIVELFSKHWWVNISNNALLGMIGIGIVSGIFYGAFQVLIRRIGSSVAILILYLIPFFGILWAGVLLGERIGVATLIGGIIALIGVKIVTSQNRKEIRV